MFNNYKVNLQSHMKIELFGNSLGQEQKSQLNEILNEMENLINSYLTEKEKLLNVVNNHQLQTQNKLDKEIAKNFELSKQLEQIQETNHKQSTEIAFLKQSLQNQYQEQFDLFSPRKQQSSLSPKINRTQSLNKHKYKRLREKENENFVCIYSSIKKVKCSNYFLEENDFKDSCLKQLLEDQLNKEGQIYKIIHQMQQNYFQKNQEFQDVISNLFRQIDQNNQEYHQTIESYKEYIQQLEQTVSKYKLGMQYLIKNNNVDKQIKQIITDSKLLCESIKQVDYSQEDLIDYLLQFNQTRDQMIQIQQYNDQIKQTYSSRQSEQLQIYQCSKQINDYEQEINDLTQQRLELLEVSQQMNEQIQNYQGQLEELQKQNMSLTQLFTKSITDLELLQQENENLRKSYSQSQTSRTHEGSIQPQKHFMIHRYSTYLDQKQRESISCKNSLRLDSRHFKFEFSSDQKRRQNQEIDEICIILDKVLNKGIDTIDCINDFQCQSGNFKIQIMWQKIREILSNFYYSIQFADQIFEHFNVFCQDMQLDEKIECTLIQDKGIMFSAEVIEANEKCIRYMLHGLVSLLQVRPSELQFFGQQLIDLCMANDQVIIQEIEKQVQIQSYLKQLKNRKLRDLQISICRMLMEIFKQWKTNYLSISEGIFNLCKGQSCKQQLNKIEKSELGYMISKELSNFLMILQQL